MKVKVRVKQKTQKTTTVVDDAEDRPAVGARHHHLRQVERDCGTSQDPGYDMTRDGQFAMDAETFRGLLQALQSNANEISRSEICKTTFDHAYLTAAQLGAVLDLFRNEITRLEVAQAAAPRVVNPLQALGFASKWKNSISAQEYTQLMASQR